MTAAVMADKALQRYTPEWFREQGRLGGAISWAKLTPEQKEARKRKLALARKRAAKRKAA